MPIQFVTIKSISIWDCTLFLNHFTGEGITPAAQSYHLSRQNYIRSVDKQLESNSNISEEYVADTWHMPS